MPGVLSKFYVSNFEKYCDMILKNNIEMKGYNYSFNAKPSVNWLKYSFDICQKDRKNGALVGDDKFLEMFWKELK